MQTHSPEVEKGVEAGKKLPRKFSSVAESFLANHTRDFAFFNNLIFCFEEIKFSVFAKLNNSSSQFFFYNTVPLHFVISQNICAGIGLSKRESVFFL